MYRYRKGFVSDAPAVLALADQWANEMITIGYEYTERTQAAYEARVNDYLWVAEYRGRVIGYTCGVVKVSGGPGLIAAGERFLDIQEVYLHPDHRDRGVGHQLLQHQMQEAEAHGVTRAIVGSSNKDWRRTVAFYEALGFHMWAVTLYK
ncbi:MAG: GNAT family N-acetyltransferase [Chloroflexi bacterium]|nr:GNAT family N-acetyltransferase [Chloroflexota bacterium]